LVSKIEDGSALETFKRFIAAQEGDTGFVDDYHLLPEAKHVVEIYPSEDGYISTIRSDQVGIASLLLGAGRENLDDEIDHSAGIYLLSKIGDPVQKDTPMAIFYTNDKMCLKDAESRFHEAFDYSKHPVEKPALIKAIISKNGVVTQKN
jgi:pyrimidine-nucleoside phosphorylase